VADLGGEAVAGWPGTWQVSGWFRRKELRAERGGGWKIWPVNDGDGEVARG